MPKISVVIPVYNTEKYLPRCLDSILGQTLADIEIICINDCSDDGSKNILDEYACRDNRVRVVDFKENKGVSFARNYGIEIATGDYVAFADSDDYLDLDFYENLYIKASQTGADIVKGDLKEIFPNGKIKTYPQNENIIKYKNKYCFYFSFTTAIYRLSLIVDNRCYFNHKLVYIEDLVWLNQIVTHANTVEVVPNVYYNYKRREDSADSPILSDKNANLAYIGYKHIFLNTKYHSKNSTLNFSVCFKNYWDGLLFLIFRSQQMKHKIQFTKLLFFFYQCMPDFYNHEIATNYQSFYPYFQENKLQAFADLIKDKRSFADLIFANLRYNMSQN